MLPGVALAGVALIGATARPQDDAVATRQAAFRMSGAVFGSMKAAIHRGDDVKTLAFAAKALASWAHALPGVFPAGSGGAGSDALPAVWSDRAGFEKDAAQYAAEADRLSVLAAAGDTAGFAAQLTVVGGTCGACHAAYKAADKP
ncbi:MAG: cytochrome c [Pseudomonadota bacterium]|nr:cytochrome c [Pseudomonadota bacterium]